MNSEKTSPIKIRLRDLKKDYDFLFFDDDYDSYSDYLYKLKVNAKLGGIEINAMMQTHYGMVNTKALFDSIGSLKSGECNCGEFHKKRPCKHTYYMARYVVENNLKVGDEKVIELYIESAKDDSVVLLGDSAGGGFTLGLAQEIDRLKLRAPKKILLISPWLDLSMENPEIEKYEKLDPYLKKSKCLAMAKSWANGTNLKDTRLSPIYGKLKVLNNISIIAGERDILYPDILKLVNMMKDENIEVDMLIGKNMLHDYPFLNIPEASVAIKHMVNILKK